MVKPFKIVIPARYNSTRLPGKPLIMIGGKTLIQHVYIRACASDANEIVIATDDERIAESAQAVGAKVCMTGQHHCSGTDRIAEVMEQLCWDDATCIVNLQGDEPCMPAALINQVAYALMSHAEVSMATLAARIESWNEAFDSNIVKVVIDRLGLALYFSRAFIPWYRKELLVTSLNSGVVVNPVVADFCPFILRHIGIYAYRAQFLRRFVHWSAAPIEVAESLEQLRTLWYGERIYVSIAQVMPGPGVDVLSDVEKVRVWLAC